MRHRTVLEYQRYRWLKVTLLILLVSIGGYVWYTSPVGRYGGTLMGYGLGTLGALIILLLLWFGIQKRRFRANSGNLQGWLSAHVYLGTSLIVIATLHTGFQVGWNVHTLAYVLMLGVIISGFYGVYAYMRIPELMTENRAEDTFDSLVLKIADIDREAQRLGVQMPDNINQAVQDSIKNTRIGGGLLAQLSGRVRGCPTDRAVALCKSSVREIKGDAAKVNTDLYAMLLRKQKLVARARADIRYKAILDLWLYFHVPLSIALLAALIAHVIAVFFYW
ncbi:MAG: hypothetical protein JNK75_03595 [Betaproteobacteria bacterium]|nr:hypothetical protein [Betaproteobacteria bacterium]